MHDAFNEKEGLPSAFAQEPVPPIQSGLRHRPMASSSSYGANTDTSPQPSSAPHVRLREGVVAQQQQGWWEWLVNVAIFPLRFVLNAATDLLHFISKLLSVLMW